MRLCSGDEATDYAGTKHPQGRGVDRKDEIPGPMLGRCRQVDVGLDTAKSPGEDSDERPMANTLASLLLYNLATCFVVYHHERLNFQPTVGAGGTSVWFTTWTQRWMQQWF